MAYIFGNVGDGLGIGQMMAVRKMLHARIPALIMAVIHQLPGQYGKVLACDSGHHTIRCSRS